MDNSSSSPIRAAVGRQILPPRPRMWHLQPSRATAIRIAGIDRHRSGIVFTTPSSPSSWIVALVLKPTPDRDWLEKFAETFDVAADQQNLVFEYELDTGLRRPSHYSNSRRKLLAYIVRRIRSSAGVILRVTCPPSSDQIQRAMAEAQWLVNMVNEAVSGAESGRMQAATAQAEAVARLTDAIETINLDFRGSGGANRQLSGHLESRS